MLSLCIEQCHLQKKNKNTFLFVIYTIIQNITSSEICALHLTQPSAHKPEAVGNAEGPGELLGVRCLAQGSHLSRGQILPEPRFEPTTSGVCNCCNKALYHRIVACYSVFIL